MPAFRSGCSPSRLVLATVHPLNSAGSFVGDEYVIADYLRPRRYVDTVRRDDLTMTFHGEHRPTQAYTEALAGAGFVIEAARADDPRSRHAVAPDPVVPQPGGADGLTRPAWIGSSPWH